MASAQVTAGHARLELQDGTDATALLQRAAAAARLTRFELQRLSLQEIFIRLVAADSAAPVSGAARAELPHG